MTTALETLDRAYEQMMRAFVRRGQALHYTELARELGLTPEAGRGVLADLMGTGVPAWLYDGTDYVASFAPFNNVPTQYRVTVEGQQPLVRPVRLRSAGGLLALPRQGRDRRGALSRLRGGAAGGRPRWAHRLRGARHDPRLRGHPFPRVAGQPGVQLKPHEPLPVGRTCEELVTL